MTEKDLWFHVFNQKDPGFEPAYKDGIRPAKNFISFETSIYALEGESWDDEAIIIKPRIWVW